MLWDMAGARKPQTLTGHEDYVTTLAFSSDGMQLISSSRDRTVRLWDLARQEGFNTYPHGYATLAVSFSKDSRYLVSVARDLMIDANGFNKPRHTVALWQVTGQTLQKLGSSPFSGRSHSGLVRFAA
jgi:WD40 repeat protein